MILDDSKVRNADKIFVLEEGRIQEEGTHAELIAKSGLYFNLVKKQSTSKSMGDLANVEEESLGTDRDDNEVIRRKSGEVATRSSVNTPLSELVVPADVIREIAEREKEEQLQTSLWRVLKINSKVIIIIVIITSIIIIIIIIDETSLWRVLKINSKEWPFIAVGAISSIGMAAVAPAFALLFGNVLEILSWEDLNAAREQSKVYSFMFIGLGLSSGLAMFLQGLLVKYYGKGRFKMVQKGSWKYFPLSRFYVWHIWGATNHEVASPRLFNHSQTGFLIGDEDEQ